MSAVIHEYAHAWTAKSLGDDTAEREGRLTLNPLKHVDPIGTVALPLVLLLTSGMFLGWAKPVPYNPYNLRDRKYGNLKVAIAGPASNFLIALILSGLFRFLLGTAYISPIIMELLQFVVSINVVLGIFNLIPVPPLDGSKILYDLFPRIGEQIMRLGFFGIFIAMIAAYWIVSPIAGSILGLLLGS